MDSSFVIKPPPSAAKTRAMRDPVPVRGTVDVDLVGSKTVNPDEKGGKDHGKRDGSNDAEQRADHTPHDLVADPDSRQVILRERDVRAEDREHPDHALLRVRAYRPALDEVAPASADDPHADIQA